MLVMAISNQNRFRVLFDKKNSFRIFYLKNIFILYHWKWLPGAQPTVSKHWRQCDFAGLVFLGSNFTPQSNFVL